ncbi:MAG TPA: tryptophan--tRNA ligase [Sulfurovum sp.]|jgi:tryptophanyl-tRNA synthetase|nr:MAG: tryptophan--tRNA ligase [Sulfurovum sp. 35-42-20]OYY57594.1 MAG: tryptophan--tRNA ligase [Sulfurovum sp. 28-43-6]OYZ24418.1 MAG: tryptophan--tRNA ligase [Sulfurovum sp. 16-42-52]OYZ49687.1 MAG: tryptophan--tRNA ligase [Sulfurovum sp. 24-42-9]OZA44036.1 MAG: tryptophan--tRNA ligase [Sulfurovum sp. 17-42-90]OZA59447.1 MAG: tryptophan--tRNA ligase [Sulfurovum sp. 39-42-12]HQR73477.1 tryptophan--tRNA ligase [Sulfurovum sp.]
MRVLTGIQASGKLHIGNYFGAMKPMVELQEAHELFTFIANYHSLTTSKDAATLKQYTIDAAVDYLSLGIDPQKTTFWVQSDMPEVLELYWILSKFTPMGLLERAHSYKDKVAKGIAANHALFSYPVLMAADILMLDTQKVPVGKDQIQHIEMTRDIAIKFNNEYGEIFTLPEHMVQEDVATIPGIDGQKMSKSYGNAIDLFMDEKALQQRCNKIVSTSTPLGEPLAYEGDNIYALSSLFLNASQKTELQERYKSGKEGYGHFKKYLKELIWEELGEAREKRAYYLTHMDEVHDILKEGAQKARAIAQTKMLQVKDAIGLL